MLIELFSLFTEGSRVRWTSPVSFFRPDSEKQKEN
jgi:hypothetical protein